MRRTNTAVWIEKYNRWQIKVQKDNIRKTFYSSTPGRAGQREANSKADTWLDDNMIDVKIKVNKTVVEYIEQLKLTTSKAHWVQYDSYFRNWVIPQIGNVRMENLNEQHLQNVINTACSKGKSKKTLSNIRACLQAWLKFCRKSNYTKLFIEGLSIPKSAPVKKKNILKPEDMLILFSSDKTFIYKAERFDLYIYAYRFQVLTGLRPGELIGLKWTDIDNNTVYINRSINAQNETTSGKNDNALRDFKLTKNSSAILEKQRQMLTEKEIVGEYVFPNKHGDYIAERNYCDRWHKYCNHNKISVPVTPYEMRHSFVSIVKNLPEGYLKQLVGHSKNMDTYGVYSHELDKDKEEAAKMIQGIFDELIGDIL